MTTDKSFNVELLNVGHDWLHLEFQIGNEIVAVNASGVLNDPFEVLISIARFLVSSEIGQRHFHLYLEPQICSVAVEKFKGNESVDIALDSPLRMLVANQILGRAVAVQIWRALSAFETTFDPAVKNGHWTRKFPAMQMQLLMEEIKKCDST